jgi:hypothetical protein
MNRHGAGPEALRARLSHDAQILQAHIFHRARDGSDVARASRLDENDAYVF